jgi:hypothetical protein
MSKLDTSGESPLRKPVNKLKMGDFVIKSRLRDGLPSVDRNNKATLLLTGPCSTIKSYAKDSTPRIVKLQDAS